MTGSQIHGVEAVEPGEGEIDVVSSLSGDESNVCIQLAQDGSIRPYVVVSVDALVLPHYRVVARSDQCYDVVASIINITALHQHISHSIVSHQVEGMMVDQLDWVIERVGESGRGRGS